MEESSEKRRERLQAMRMEASTQAEPLSSSSTPPIQSLSNPLIHATEEKSPSVPRFDFYTDPMAAFSGAKRRSAGGGSYYSPESFSSPIRSHSPMARPSYQPNAGPRNYHTATTQPPPPHQFQLNQSPDHTPWRNPIQFPSPVSGHYRGTPPTSTNSGVWNRSGGGSSGHSFPPSYSRGGDLPSPGFGRGGSPSPHSNSGRGHGWRFTGSGGSPILGRSGGRGRGFYYDHGSARREPEHFYIKAMVKDPWRKLKPIVGNILVPRAGSGSWLLKSIAASKRPKVAESDSGGEFKSRSSLAECLALSFEEAVNEV